MLGRDRGGRAGLVQDDDLLPRLSPIAEASGRANTSAGPPAAYGLTSMIGLDG
jgi:hypothetical protein